MNTIKKNNQKAFTLIELILTLVISSILAAIVAPAMFDLTSLNQNSFYGDVKYALNYAQKYSYSKRTTVYVSISSTQLKICSVADCSVVLSNVGQNLVLSVPSTTTISSSPSTTLYSYDIWGNPSFTQTLTLTIASKPLYIETTGFVHE